MTRPPHLRLLTGAQVPATDGRALDIEALLTIDVDAEVRKLSHAHLEGPWQLPTELVRRALEAGASRIAVTFERRSVTIHDDGGGLDPEALRALATLLDEDSTPGARHRALVTLEAAGAQALIALVGLAPDALQLDVRAGARADRLLCRRGSRPQLAFATENTEAWKTRIELSGARIDPRQARAWMQTACRFCPEELRIDGSPLATGFRDFVARVRSLPDPLEGELMIPLSGETACVWLLLEGVVSAHLTIPDAPSFEAAVEMGPLVGAEKGAAALREAFSPHVPLLIDWAGQVIHRLTDVLLEKPEPVQHRIRALVTQAVKHGVRAAKLRAAAVYRSLPGPDGGERWLSLDELSRMAREDGERMLTALSPEDDPSRHALPTAPVLVLDRVERGELAGLLKAGFRAPPLRPRGRGRLARALDALAGRGGLLARAAQRLRHPALPPPLPWEELSPTERAFLTALRRALAAEQGGRVELHFCGGAGPIRRVGRNPRWVLPRGNTTVRACLKAWEQDETWIYPAALAVLDGKGLPVSRTREDWLGR